MSTLHEEASTAIMAPTAEQLAAKVVPLRYGWIFGGFKAVPVPEQQYGPSRPTVADLLTYMAEHGIPLTARLEYWQCGSHTVALDWTEEA